jgi:DNA-binding MarR family transcriptional regulator
MSYLNMDKDEDILSHKYATTILLYLLDNGSSKKTDLQQVSTMHTIDKLLPLLENSGLISIEEQRLGRRIYAIQLTDKGKRIAEGLKKAEQAVYSQEDLHALPPNYTDQFKNLSAVTHLNVLDDRIAIRDLNYGGAGHDRIVFVYLKLNGNNIIRLWCEVDKVFDCVHTKYAWSLPDVQAMTQIQYAKGNINRVQK